MVQVFIAVLAGILTVGAPCIVPLLPILLGTSVGQKSRSRPIFIVAGFVITFAALGVSLSFFIAHLGLDPDTLRHGAIILLGIFGLLMIWPKPFELLTIRMNGLINRVSKPVKPKKDNNLGAFVLGMTLGAVWTPCAGPVLGTILTLVATQDNTARSALLLLAYSAGAGIPMLIIAYGSRYVTTRIRGIARNSLRLQQIFGVLIILFGIAMYKNYDISVENSLAAYFPSTNGIETSLIASDKRMLDAKKIIFRDYGPAPEFTGIDHWLNSKPLTLQGLRGKVVLIDFWTYSCINCIRTLPYLTRWYDTYKDHGLVIIGVHTPEFPFEKSTQNVADAIKRFHIHYPVAQDNEYSTWNVYNNEYWPAEYLIDKNGDIIYEHFGEGHYDRTENAIRQLLGIAVHPVREHSIITTSSGNDHRLKPVTFSNGVNPIAKTRSLGMIGSPEMYFGTFRLQYLTPYQSPSAAARMYTFPKHLDLNNFALQGMWMFAYDYITPVQPGGSIKLRFYSARLYIVAASKQGPVTLKVTVDGRQQPDVVISKPRLYTLFNSDDYAEHTVEIEVLETGFKAFTFTFG